ncbi:SMC-Scp complex subunit ScpB [Rhodopirellula bahusiensis]|uniref:Transcriptional regulator n=2 Tax=Rhodopirellula bahusiensis TaxID=2014065 RepID=A0A2G1WB79_9BACT|nr:SMC-Scp complex subunit ScpB [Rhodopirellula bahusiensis]PHQ35889.1 transcriptional regulator [Rhodopirellula bahusiensis]
MNEPSNSPEEEQPVNDLPETDAPENEIELDNEFDDDEEGFSLEQLGAAYARVAAMSESGDDAPADLDPAELLRSEPEAKGGNDESGEDFVEEDPDSDEALAVAAQSSAESDSAADHAASPEAIVEAALFVGHPENLPLTPPRLASIMRGFSPEEVVEIIDNLNTSYRAERQGMRIVEQDGGYRMVLAPEVENVRAAFSGKIRETRLNQAAVEVLSLVAYQPGITSARVTDLRGRDSGSLLNQMVRRRLVEVKREPGEGTDKLVSRFYPAERLLVLLGLETIDDLPHVEEANM